MQIPIKRVYETPAKADGKRILVDRLWPRGLSKEDAAVDLWLKDVAPSNELRKWFGHDPAKWSEFQKRYLAELQHDHDSLSQLKELAHQSKVTLLYGAKDEEHNQAVVLQKLLERKR
ncbi:DUF488 domain-containing protein [Edaphobacter albus]|uniref:DUF488 domain-containing protein n=1 Tax=Edaphobacter sp. 4G125 TaxID=2763071 RepID=UPI00164516A8|nr:DUF488 domain-containing protein [Edaphobacter sp. 4G125]QNI38154.1 DUF488 domain-containing protein [Edaphobacter sp. 4G125]